MIIKIEHILFVLVTLLALNGDKPDQKTNQGLSLLLGSNHSLIVMIIITAFYFLYEELQKLKNPPKKTDKDEDYQKEEISTSRPNGNGGGNKPGLRPQRNENVATATAVKRVEDEVYAVSEAVGDIKNVIDQLVTHESDNTNATPSRKRKRGRSQAL
jgi:hypothetical protein